MAEYIEREAAIQAAKHAWAKGLEPTQYIEIIPVADVEEVRHGRWILCEDTNGRYVKYNCPYCFDYTAFREDPGEYTVHGNYIYCRKCGAKMDGGDDHA